MNSIEVSAFCLYRNEVRWTKRTPPCWRQEITVGAILDRWREKGGRGRRGHAAWASRVNEAGVRDPQMGEKDKQSTHSNIRLKRDNMLYL